MVQWLLILITLLLSGAALIVLLRNRRRYHYWKDAAERYKASADSWRALAEKRKGHP